MTLSTQAEDFDRNNHSVNYDVNPDLCPICHAHIEPKRYTAAINSKADRLEIMFRCSSRNCDRLFVAGYWRNSRNEYELHYCVPRLPAKVSFSEQITNISPAFAEIYNQGLAAESTGLTEIAGLGLRKAFEFLVKDFLIQQRPDDKEDIEKTFLGTVIKNYVSDSNLKQTAERAVWLGNDETHYVRKWVDKDIEDLKRLIKLSVNWIENILLTQEYIQSMPQGGPTATKAEDTPAEVS